MTKQPHLVVVLTEAEKRDQLIREALQSEPISMYPDFIAAVGAALDDLDRFRSERSFIVGCNEGFEAAIDQAARLIEEYSIMDTSGGKELSPRIDGNREGLHYAISIRALVAGNKAPAPTATSKVMVKLLEWRRGYCDDQVTISQATTLGGLYQVRVLKGIVWLDKPGSKSTYPSTDDAIAAAQADYERLILSALADTAPSPLVEGWKLLPIEPTKEMAFAGINAVTKGQKYDDPRDPQFSADMKACGGDKGAVRAMQSYRAMAAAALPAPRAEGDE